MSLGIPPLLTGSIGPASSIPLLLTEGLSLGVKALGIPSLLDEAIGPGSSIPLFLTEGLSIGPPAQLIQTSRTGRSRVPEVMPDHTEHRRQIARRLNDVIGGKMDVGFDVQLTSNSGSTTVNDARIGYYSCIIACGALTPNAKADLAAGIQISGMIKGQCTINHRNSSDGNRWIRLAILG